MALLPDDPAELRSLLEDAERRADAAIARARADVELRRAAERRAVLREFSGRLAERAALLRELGASDDEAESIEALAAATARELAAFEPVIVSPDAESLEIAEALDPPVPLPAIEPAALSPPPAPAATPSTPDLLREIATLAGEARQLSLVGFARLGSDAAASTSELDELEARLSLLALRGRALQASHPLLADHGNEGGWQLRQAFGAMTRIANDVLIGRFIPYLRRDHDADWDAEIRRWQARLDDVLLRRRNDSDRAEAERRRLAQEAAQRRVRELVLTELAQVVSESSRDPLWEFDALELVREAVSCCDPGDPQLLDLVAPHARLLSTGAEFRGLRRKLKKRLGGDRSTGLSAVEDAETDVQPPSAPLAHPFDKYRGSFAGRTAGIVGASCREYRRTALREFFGFDELEWVESTRTEVADGATIARRIENGAYGVVFLLADFCSHSLQDHIKNACKSSGVPFVLVRHGYGIVAFGRALDDAGRLVDELGVMG